MYVHDIRIRAASDYARNAEFDAWILHIAHLYSANLGKIPLGPVYRIILVCREDKDFAYEKVKLDVIEDEYKFPFAEFWKLGEKARRKLAVDFVGEKLQAIAKLQKGDPAPFKAVYEKVAATGPENTGVSEKAVASPDKKWKARWHYDYGPEKIVFSILVEPAAGGKPKLIPIHETPPYAACLEQNLGKVAWKDAKTVTLTGKKIKKTWAAKIDG